MPRPLPPWSLSALAVALLACGPSTSGEADKSSVGTVLSASAPPALDGPCRSVEICRAGCDGGRAADCTGLAAATLRLRTPGVDLAAAVTAARRGCDGGDAAGCNQLALLAHDGVGMARDLAQAAALYRKACDLGAGVGCFNLASAELTPVRADAERLFAEAAVLYRAACERGELDWCVNLAIEQSEGFGMTADPIAAAIEFDRLCTAGNDNGCVEWANALRRPGGGAPAADAERALAILAAACDRSPGGACRELAVMFGGREGIPADRVRAETAAVRGCDAGHRESCTFLGLLRDPGLPAPLPPSSEELFDWSCDRGKVPACALLGFRYRDAGRDDLARAAFGRGCDRGEGTLCDELARTLAAAGDFAGAVAPAKRACALGVEAACGALPALMNPAAAK